MIKNENMINIGIFLFGGILIATIVILLVRKPWEKYNAPPPPPPPPPSPSPFPCDPSWCKKNNYTGEECHCTGDRCTKKNSNDPCYPCGSINSKRKFVSGKCPSGCLCDPKWEGTPFQCRQKEGGGPCNHPCNSGWCTSPCECRDDLCMEKDGPWAC